MSGADENAAAQNATAASSPPSRLPAPEPVAARCAPRSLYPLRWLQTWDSIIVFVVAMPPCSWGDMTAMLSRNVVMIVLISAAMPKGNSGKVSAKQSIQGAHVAQAQGITHSTQHMFDGSDHISATFTCHSLQHTMYTSSKLDATA